MDWTRPTLLAGLAAMTAADPDASPERADRLGGGEDRCRDGLKQGTRMMLAELGVAGSHSARRWTDLGQRAVEEQ